jgi:nucleoside-diphosphate-sugar epimerase
MKVLVTGANGFIGSAVCQHLFQSGLNVRAAVRNFQKLNNSQISGLETCVVGDIDESTDWRCALDGVDVVIHTAARVHVMRDPSPDPVTEFRRVNTAGTERLARAAVRYGVRRLVYVSSVKVNGENTEHNQMFREDDAPYPTCPYGLSKFEAEVAIKKIAAESYFERVVVRPTLVYGPGVRGNIATMLSWANAGFPLPLAGIANGRSLTALENLCSFLHACAIHSAAIGETFLISDGGAISTPELFRLLARGMGKKARLYPVPEQLLRTACALCGLENMHRRLCQSLIVDTQKARTRLGWRPSVTLEQALNRTARSYLESTRRDGGAY